MKKMVIIILTIWTGIILNAQTNHGKVSVAIVNEQQTPIENATVELRKAKDSSLAKIDISDKNGIAEFENILFGKYLLKVSMTGRIAQYSSPFELSADQPQLSVSKISLQPDTKQL